MAAPAAPSQNIYSFLLPSAEQRTACRAKMATCPPVQLLNAMLKPMGLLSGGMVPSLIPGGPSAANLAKSPQSSAGAAAKIQAQEAEAKTRRDYVRYLGTVDCRYYPEAEAALAAALREDPSECVRYEAALGLNHGCCCTKKTMAALKAAASGGSEDQHPAERSERIRAAAECALMRCEAAQPAIPQLPQEKPVPSGGASATSAPAPVREVRPPTGANEPVTPAVVRPVPRSAAIPTGQRGLLQIGRVTLMPGSSPSR